MGSRLCASSSRLGQYLRQVQGGGRYGQAKLVGVGLSGTRQGEAPKQAGGFGAPDVDAKGRQHWEKWEVGYEKGR